MRPIVCKFGGSSVADFSMFRRVLEIIRCNKQRRYIIVSAPGKRYAGDEKVTDLLYRCYAASTEPNVFSTLFDKIRERYLQIAHPMGAAQKMECWLNECIPFLLANSCSAASRGEYLCARLFAEYAQIPFVDSAALIRFDENGRMDEQASIRAIHDTLSQIPYAVIPGFYGSTPSGTLYTLDRGGSDVTGALIARATGAQVYENWTDVNGLLCADPALFPEATTVKHIGYAQMELLARTGATLLHPNSIAPLRETDIPIHIRNTFCPSNSGTQVDSHSTISSPCIVAIANKYTLHTCSIFENDPSTSHEFTRPQSPVHAADASALICPYSPADAEPPCNDRLIYMPKEKSAIITALWSTGKTLHEILPCNILPMLHGMIYARPGCAVFFVQQQNCEAVLGQLYSGLCVTDANQRNARLPCTP